MIYVLVVHFAMQMPGSACALLPNVSWEEVICNFLCPGSAILSSLYPFVLAMLEKPITTTAPDGYQSSSLGVREAVLS